MTFAQHALHIYEDEAAFSRLVIAWLTDGLRKGDACVVIATPEHRAMLEKTLSGGGFSADGGGSPLGVCIAHDAAATLSQFIVDGWPDAGRFREVMGRILGSVPREKHHAVRVFGDMVALLVVRGSPAAAIALEKLWTELIKSERFSLLCSYPRSAFLEPGLLVPLEAICAEHEEVCLP